MSGLSHAPRATTPSPAAAAPAAAGPGSPQELAPAGNAAAIDAMAQQSSGAGASPPATPGAPPAAAATRGSAMVFAEAGGSEYGFTDHGLPDLASLLARDPNADLDAVLTALADNEFHVNYQDLAFPQRELHPTLAAYGDRDTPVANKTSVIVANQNYAPPNHALAGVAGQAATLQAQLAARGFGGPGVVNDLPASGIATAFGGAVNAAQAGDEVVAAFTGHGSEEGLIGITSAANDLYTNGQISGLVSAATSKDVHIRVILDACHSGNAASYVREERMNELEEDSHLGVIDRELLGMARDATNLRFALIDHANARRSALAAVVNEIDFVNDKRPPITALEAFAEWVGLVGALWDRYHQVERAYDDKIRAIWAEAAARYDSAVFVVSILCDRALTVPHQIADFARLGAQIDFLDDFANAAMRPAEDDVDPD